MFEPSVPAPQTQPLPQAAKPTDVTTVLIEVPLNTRHVRLVINRATAEVLHIAHYAENELKKEFLSIGQVLGFQISATPQAEAPPAEIKPTP